jgi:hypothetical protein
MLLVVQNQILDKVTNWNSVIAKTIKQLRVRRDNNNTTI